MLRAFAIFCMGHHNQVEADDAPDRKKHRVSSLRVLLHSDHALRVVANDNVGSV